MAKKRNHKINIKINLVYIAIRAIGYYLKRWNFSYKNQLKELIRDKRKVAKFLETRYPYISRTSLREKEELSILLMKPAYRQRVEVIFLHPKAKRQNLSLPAPY
jgi:hypothetical protein